MMRGDKKWPPEQTRQTMVEQEEEEKAIAEGPASRPRKVNKVKNETHKSLRVFGEKNFEMLSHTYKKKISRDFRNLKL
jgi:hypothetical protein